MSSGQLKGFRIGTQALQVLNLNKEVLDTPAINCRQNNYLQSILSPETISNIELAKFEFGQINKLFNEKISDPVAKTTFSEKLEDSIEIIRFLVELSIILQRIQPYWEAVDGAILPPLKAAIEEADSDSMGIKKSEISAVCEEIRKLEESKIELSGLYYYVFAQMEWFVLFYRASSLKDKERFFSKINEDFYLLVWISPFIEIAEEGDLSWEMALAQALNIQEITESEKSRVYV